MKTLNSIKGYLLGLIATAALFGFIHTILKHFFYHRRRIYKNFNEMMALDFKDLYADNFYDILLMSICLTIVMVFLWIRLSKKRSI